MVKRRASRDEVISADRRLRDHRGSGGKLPFKVPAGVNIFQPKKAGTYLLDIVPFRCGKSIKRYRDKETRFCDPGQRYYEQTYFAHRGIGPNNEWVICAAKTFGKTCYVCQHIMKLSTPDADPDTKELLKKLYAKQRQIWLVYNHAEKDKGVQLWEYSYALFGKYMDNKLNTALPEEKKRWRLFADPNKGYHIRASCTEESMGGGTSFLEFSDISFKKRKEPLDEALLEAAIDLPSLIQEPDYAAVKKLMLQGGEDIEEDDDEDDSDIEEDEEEDAEDSDDEDDDDEADDQEDDTDDDDDADGDDEDSDAEDDDDDSEDDADESEDEEDDEDDDNEDGDVSIGMRVKFVYKGKNFKGKVKKITKGKGGVELAHIRCPNSGRIHIVDVDELIPLPTKAADEDDEPAPKKKAKAKSKSKKRRDDEDEEAFDPDDEDDDDDDEDEDDMPRKKKRRKARA